MRELVIWVNLKWKLVGKVNGSRSVRQINGRERALKAKKIGSSWLG